MLPGESYFQTAFKMNIFREWQWVSPGLGVEDLRFIQRQLRKLFYSPALKSSAEEWKAAGAPELGASSREKELCVP